MRARHERLGRVLRLRRATQRLALAELAARLAVQREREAQLERAEDAAARWAAVLLAPGEGAEASALRAQAAALARVYGVQEELERARRQAAREAEAAAEAYRERRRELQVAERLRARWRRLWVQELERKEQRWLDDLHLLRWPARTRGEASP